MRGLEGKRAIITGGASGLGVHILRAFASARVQVVVFDLLDSKAAELAPGCEYVRGDLRSDADIAAVVAHTAQCFGGVDFLLNLACTYAENGGESARQEWLDGFNINLFGHVQLAREAYPYLRDSGAASIVNFTSESAHVGLPSRWIYPATKAAIEQVTRSQALDYAKDGIRVNALMPGWVEKPWLQTLPEERRQQLKEMAGRLHMLGRAGRPDEIAAAALFLCSQEASFMTGSVMCVDGGHSAMGPQGKEVMVPGKLRSEGDVTFIGQQPR